LQPYELRKILHRNHIYLTSWRRKTSASLSDTTFLTREIQLHAWQTKEILSTSAPSGRSAWFVDQLGTLCARVPFRDSIGHLELNVDRAFCKALPTCTNKQFFAGLVLPNVSPDRFTLGPARDARTMSFVGPAPSDFSQHPHGFTNAHRHNLCPSAKPDRFDGTGETTRDVVSPARLDN
jgi:hypothetical protein